MSRRYQGDVLDEVVKAQDDKSILYIGAQSSFFFIGTKNDYEKLIDGISDKYERQFASTAKKMSKERAKIRKDIDEMKQGEKESDKKFSERLFIAASAYKDIIPKEEEACRRNKEFTPIRTRSIKSFDTKKVESGYAIIVEGYESGKYWMKSEWDEEHK